MTGVVVGSIVAVAVGVATGSSSTTLSVMKLPTSRLTTTVALSSAACDQGFFSIRTVS